jgi:Protein of unknown function (DUF2800)
MLELRPSNAHRWMNCAGQPQAVKDLPDKSSKYAERGTVAHGLMELALRLDFDDDDLIGMEGKYLTGLPRIAVDDEMIRGVGHALDYVRSYCTLNKTADFYAECEVKIVLGDYETGGTSDIVLDNLPLELIIVDYKNGAVAVEAEENPQLMLYAAGYLQEHRARTKPKTKVKLVIVQPNAHDGEPPVKEYNVDPAFLLYFVDQATRAAENAHAKNPARSAGEHCRFCRAAGSCKTYAEYILAQAGLEFSAVEEQTMPDAKDFTPKQIATVLKAVDLMRAWIVSVEELAIERMLDGRKVPGFKVVGSRPQRRWDDDAGVYTFLIRNRLNPDLFAPRSVLSPAQLEKRTKGKTVVLSPKLFEKLKPHITHNPIEPRIAPLSDPRGPFVPGQEFEKTKEKV